MDATLTDTVGDLLDRFQNTEPWFTNTGIPLFKWLFSVSVSPIIIPDVLQIMCSDVNLIWTHGGQMEDGTVWPTLFLVSCAVKKRKLEKSWGCGTACYLPFRREVRKIVWHNTDTWLRWERPSHLDLQTEMHATTDEAGGGIRSSSRLPSLPPSDRQWESERRGSEWWEEVWCLSLQSAFLFSFSIPKDEQSKQESNRRGKSQFLLQASRYSGGE